MLILTRKPGESLYIGDSVKVTVVELKGHQVRVGITAPPELRIYREEIYLQILEENKQAAAASQAGEAGLEGLAAAWSEHGAPAGAGDKGGDDSGKPRLGSLSSFVTARSSGLDPQVVVKRRRAKKPDE